MPLKQVLTKPTDNVAEAIDAYCAAHNLPKMTAGRIAWERLLAKPPSPAEVRRATVDRGTPENLARYNESRET